MSPRQRRRRWVWRGVRVLLLVYLGGALVLDWGQGWLIFPGASTQGSAGAVVRAGEGEEIVKLKTAHGEEVVAIYGVAANGDGSARADAHARPTVLYFYGNGEDVARSMREFERLRRQGMNVMVPDFVGYGMSGGAVSEQGIYDTADASYDFLVKQKAVEPKKLVVAGRSLGGAAAVYLASRKPVAGLVTFSTFATIKDVAQHVVPMYPVGLFIKVHFDNVSKMAEVKCPVMIVHGRQDDFIAFETSRRLAEACKSGQARIVPVEGADHNGIFNVGGEKLIEQVGRFVEQVAAEKATTHPND